MDVEGRHAFWATMRGFAAAGKTVVFATHYLEEADAYADRTVLMARGRVVADGPTTEIKAMVGAAHDPRHAARRRARRARAPARRDHVERRGEAVVLHCADSDAAMRALLAAYPDAHDIEITRRRPRGGVPAADRRRRPTRRRAMSSVDVRALRAAAHVPQPALLHLLVRLPARPLLRDRRAEPQRAQLRADRHLAPLYYMVGLAAFGTMNAVLSTRRAHRRPSARSAGTASCA